MPNAYITHPRIRAFAFQPRVFKRAGRARWDKTKNMTSRRAVLRVEALSLVAATAAIYTYCRHRVEHEVELGLNVGKC